MMSKPATHNSTANSQRQRRHEIPQIATDHGSPRSAIQVAIGASIKAAPNQKWAAHVNRFV